MPQKGFHHSDETKAKISLSNSGRPSCKKGIPIKQEHKEKISLSRSGKFFGENNSMFGKQQSKETKQKIKESQTGCKNPRWKGGVSFEPYCVKFTKEFKDRVRKFFGNKCVECGVLQNGKKLDVHHVNFDKQSCCNDTTPLFVSLCPSCHAKTTHGDRAYWEQHFTSMITNQYEGKCYISKGV